MSVRLFKHSGDNDGRLDQSDTTKQSNSRYISEMLSAELAYEVDGYIDKIES